MSETSPFRENCQRCNELQAQLNRAQTKIDNLDAQIQGHSCWSLGAVTEGSTALEFMAVISMVIAVGTGAAAAAGQLRWGVAAVFFVAAIILRVWGLSFRIL